MRVLVLSIAAVILTGLLIALFRTHLMPKTDTLSTETSGDWTFGFTSDRLSTNTAQHSIPLDQVLDGGPGKDGIPALTNPKFTTVAKSNANGTDGIDGILVSSGAETKFYPYNILVWHEVINDVVGGTPLVITFCPLCGSAVVYEAQVRGKPEQFGVSGKLYNSNLLMYDKSTESLWSQVEGEAVVGDLTGARLALYPSQVVSFKTVRERYPQAQILSTDTGYRRDYAFYPYGNYNNTSNLYFPVSVTDTRLPVKEIMYIVNFNGRSVAFTVRDLKPDITASVDVAGKKLTAALLNGIIEVKPEGGMPLPGYTAMWFAWAAYHQSDGVVWTAAKQV